MKKLLVILILAFSVTQLWSQDNKPKDGKSMRIPLIGEKAPSFTAESTNGIIHFPADLGRSWKILFSHPQDFTPVCSTEIMELAKVQDQFAKADVKLVVISADSIYRHQQWKKSLEDIMVSQLEPAKINFPLVSDINLSVSKEYGMLYAKSYTSAAVRGVFIIDPDNIIQGIYFYPMHVGRNTDELLRFVQALQVTTAKNVLTPANWRPGQDYLVLANPRTDMSNQNVLPEGYYSPVWYLTYKKADK